MRLTSDSQSDWTRFAKTKRAPALNQLIGAPVTVTVTAILGVFATSAVNDMYGKMIWNPIQVLQMLLGAHYNAATRAGCFFAGLGFFVSQIQVNMAQNSISCGMDLASFWPKYLDVARGGVLMCVVAYLINPWRFVNSPGTFITVLSSFGMFVSPLAGINAVDFWLIRRQNWKVPDLYIGNSSSIYWYTYGVNLRAVTAWTLAVWPSFPGFIAKTSGSTVAVGWLNTFNVSWIVGFMGGGTVYYILCLIFPPPGKPYVSEHFISEDTEGIDGLEVASSDVVAVEVEKGKH